MLVFSAFLSPTWAADFPARFSVTCPNLLQIPPDHPDRVHFEQACNELTKVKYSLERVGDDSKVTPSLSSLSEHHTLFKPNRSFRPYDCVTAPFMALCKVPVGEGLRIPGMDFGETLKSKYGFILIVDLVGVFDLKPEPEVQRN
ncbi:MAG: hypothetical protein Q4G70_11810 [Pseudomonadota bacterium]|nr:hypothetical protein [Pseudomonadota bacterium]